MQHASSASAAPPPPALPSHAGTPSSAEIEAHFRELCDGLDPLVDPSELAAKVASGLPSEGMSSDQLSELMAETAAYQSSMHPDFGILAARVSVARLHSITEPGLLPTLRKMRDHTLSSGESAPLVTAEIVALADSMGPELEAALRHEADWRYDYFGLRTLQRSYLKRTSDGTPLERPQHMLMRVALCVHGADKAAVLHAYDLMSRGLYTHATPTLFNAGSPRQQLSSCFLLTAKEDSIDGIFETLRRCERPRCCCLTLCLLPRPLLAASPSA